MATFFQTCMDKLVACLVELVDIGHGWWIMLHWYSSHIAYAKVETKCSMLLQLPTGCLIDYYHRIELTRYTHSPYKFIHKITPFVCCMQQFNNSTELHVYRHTLHTHYKLQLHTQQLTLESYQVTLTVTVTVSNTVLSRHSYTVRLHLRSH